MACKDDIAAVENANSLPAREAGLAAVTALSKEIGTPVAPFLTALLPVILTAYADKVRLPVDRDS